METYTNEHYIVAEDIKILFGDTYLHHTQDPEYDEMISFGKVLDLCKDAGYITGTILVIAESFTSGTLYRYGNYKQDFWEIVGTTRGFA